MAKSNLDKLKDTVSVSLELLTQVQVGGETGQYPQSAVDTFREAIKKAGVLVEDESAEPSQFDIGNNALNEAKETFIASKIVEVQKEELPDVLELALIGTPSQLKGSHSIHFNGGIVTFLEGKAFVPSGLGNELIKAGYAK